MPHCRHIAARHCHHVATTSPPHRRHTAATLPPHRRHIAAILPPHWLSQLPQDLFSANEVLFGPKHDLIGRNKVLWQLWQPMWRQYGGNMAAMWRQCGSSVAAMWRRCGGDVVAMWQQCLAAIWRQRGIVFMSLPCCCQVVVMS